MTSTAPAVALPELTEISARIVAAERLSRADGLRLIESADLHTLGELASLVRFRKHPERRVSYIVDRNINPTNICVARCRFCAFDRLPGDPEGYVLSLEEICQKIDELLEVGGVQVLMQGGHHPELGLPYYVNLFEELRRRYPKLHIHGLSPSEVVHIAKLSRVSVAEAVAALRSAGLNSIPGGGAEILVDRVRQQIAPGKSMTEDWLGVMREAHQQGLRTTATMMYGHVETLAERIDHLLSLRDLQDSTGGFTAFICWPFQPGGSELDLPRSGAPEFLRMNAVARLMLDNFDNQQTSFVTQGDKLGQLALFYGCNDFGGTMLEENVVSAAGTQCLITIEQVEDCIRKAGFEPVRRNMFYEIL
jgi:cyclic dehypoxanthinyl futalosine synthase